MVSLFYVYFSVSIGFNIVAIGKYYVPCCKEAYTSYTFSLQGMLMFSLSNVFLKV